MATFKHASSNGTIIKQTKSIFLASRDYIVSILAYSNQDAIVCTENQKTISIWFIFKLQSQDETNIHLQLSYMKSKDAYVANVQYQYYIQGGLMIIINYITFSSNSTAINIIIMTKTSWQLIHIFGLGIQLCNVEIESQNKGWNTFSENLVLANVLQYLKLILMIRNITFCDSIIASKAECMPENIMKKSPAKENDKERKIFEREILFF